MTDSVAAFPLGWRLTDSAGVPVSGGYLMFRHVSSATPYSVFADYDLTDTLGDTVYLNSAGQPVASEGSGTTVAVYVGTDPFAVDAYDADGVLVPGVSLDGLKGAVIIPTYETWSELTVSDDYAVEDATNHLHINYTGSGGDAISWGDPSTYVSLFVTKLTNSASLAAVKIKPQGYSRRNATGASIDYFWLWPGTTATVTNVNAAWSVEYNYRWQTLTNEHFYFDPSGSDDNDGLSSSRAFRTMQYAINLVEAEIDALLHGVTIHLAGVTFKENNVVQTKGLTGNHVITYVGTTGTVWQCDSGQTCFTVRDHSKAIMRSMKVEQPIGSGALLLNCSQGGVLDIGDGMVFGECAGGYHVAGVNGGSIGCETSAIISITGTSYASHLYLSGSKYLCSGVATYSVAAATFTAFMQISDSNVNLSGFAYSGAGSAGGSTGIPYMSVGIGGKLIGFWNGLGGGSSVGVRVPGNGAPQEIIYPQAAAVGGTALLGTTNYELDAILLKTGGSIQAGTGSVLAALTQSGTSLLVSTGQFGYSSGGGQGGTVTQATSKTTSVTLDKVCGEITMNNAALANDTQAVFNLNNSLIANGDVIILNHVSGGTIGDYSLTGQCFNGGCSIALANISGGSLSDAVVIRYAVIKAATS